MTPRIAVVVAALAVGPVPACDTPSGSPTATNPATQASSSPPPPPAAPPEPPRAPDIVVDAANVSVGTERVSARELGLRDKIAVLLKDRPAVGGGTIDLIVMRNARPSVVVDVIAALRRASSAGAGVKTEARDGTTQR
ncbi:MAG: hypothetical protein M3O50_05935, partial [Myxococcota bacterium]|nr:hypothetical protein [Myxococcota bacterium]